MSILDYITGKTKLAIRRPAIAPTVTDSTNSALIPQDDNSNSFIAGHENFNDYVDLPNILGPLNTNAAYHDPERTHSPFTVERGKDRIYGVGPTGVEFFDGANPDIERIPRSELQVQFDQKREIPIPPALIPASGVEVPGRVYNYGWAQVHPLEWDGMYSASVMTAPSQQLSRGINVLQSRVPDDTHRQSLKTRAPKQKRSVQ